MNKENSLRQLSKVKVTVNSNLNSIGIIWYIVPSCIHIANIATSIINFISTNFKTLLKSTQPFYRKSYFLIFHMVTILEGATVSQFGFKGGGRVMSSEILTFNYIQSTNLGFP